MPKSTPETLLTASAEGSASATPLAASAEGSASAELPQTLRARGYRLTPQRQMVLDAVIGLGQGTAEEIGSRVRESSPGVNITTVYRTLDLLEQLGLVRHRHFGHGAPLYHASDNDIVHAVCHGCGAVLVIPQELLAPVAKWLTDERGFDLDTGHIALAGMCADCAAGRQAT
ncbi:MAG: transcriptional repressor [Geodermatophilaceae bacterium]|nr:transcriptional repressor [Geodermatophilaceae bacterium]MDQ3456121.1 transcriptional repressor [Actinomycetota bacterium]